MRKADPSDDLGTWAMVAGRPHVSLTAQDDSYVVESRAERVSGLAGDDEIVGGVGFDILRGGSGDDQIRGGKGGDRLEGGGGDDDIRGDPGNDTLYGGAGDDIIYGRGGADVMIGGAGDDQIVVNSPRNGNASDGKQDTVVYEHVEDSQLGGARDMLYGFKAGEDKVDVSAIDADPTTPADDRFHYIGDHAFSGTAGELRVEAPTFGSTTIQADVDGDGVADLRIDVFLVSADPLTRADFIL